MQSSKLYYQILIVVALGLFTDGYFLYMTSCTEPLIKLSLHLSEFQVGIMQSIAPVGAVIGAICSGPLTDKHGRKPMLAIDLTLFLVVSILLFFAHSYSEIVVERFVIGVGVGVGYPIYAAYLAESTAEREHGNIVAISMFVNVLAMPAVAVVGYFLYRYFANDSWRYIFLSAVIPTILCFISRNKLPESKVWQKLDKSKVNEGFFSKYAHLFSTEYRLQTIILASCWFIMDISYYGIGLFTTDIVHMFKHSSGVENNFLNDLYDSAIINSFAALGAFIGIWSIKYFSKKKLQKYGFYLSGVGLCLLSQHESISSSGIFLIAAFSLYNIAINVGPDITTYLLPSESYPPEFKATGHAFSTAMAKTGAVVGSMGMPIVQSLVGIHGVLLFLGVSLFVGGYVTNFIKKEN
jgi:putative MFS transporter